MSQLAAIRKHEAALGSRLSSGVAASAEMADELSELQISTDRLNRLVDAMSD